MSSPSYSVPPPAYNANPSSTTKKQTYGTHDLDAQAPLLGGSSSAAAGNAIWNQPNDVGGIEDFNYGVSAWDSSPEIKNAFILKVYSILSVQILATTVVGAGIYSSKSAQNFVIRNPWILMLTMLGTLVNLGLLYWKRHSHPTNYVLLGSFTLLESFAIGVTISFYDANVVLGALLITLGVFLGLTLFTLQSKYDFSGMGPFLFAGLMVLVFGGFVSMFFPYNSTSELIYGAGGALLFSGYVVYDTYLITKRYSPDEYISAAISLYLDFINLFISILRVLGAANRD